MDPYLRDILDGFYYNFSEETDDPHGEVWDRWHSYSIDPGKRFQEG